jgi:D-alanyl-D-alanine carboxypeptidase
MAVAGGVLVESFARVGWKWGGTWASSPDYQHFSTTGG